MSFVVSKMSESKLHLRLRQIKHCAICGAEGASQRNGVYSCEGCAEFYEKTIRKDRRYSCRFQDNCRVKNNSLPSHKLCKCCRYKKCCSEGMGITLRYSHDTTTATTSTTSDTATTSITSSATSSSTSSLPSTSSPDIVFVPASAPAAPITNRARNDCVSRVLVLENCVFVTTLCPAFVLPYLRNENEPQLLNVASANFAALIKSENYYPVTERFFSLFVETAGRKPPLEPLIIHHIRMLMEQFIFATAEIIKSQINSEVEFAALSQMTIIKIAGEQSFTTEPEERQCMNRVSESYRYCCRQTGVQYNESIFWKVIIANNKIHEYRQSTKNQIQQLLAPPPEDEP